MAGDFGNFRQRNVLTGSVYQQGDRKAFIFIGFSLLNEIQFMFVSTT